MISCSMASLPGFVQRFRALGALGPIAVFTAVGPGVGAVVLAATSGWWFPPLEALEVGAVPAVLTATVALAGLSLAPTHAASLVAGMLFGAVGGTAVALAGVLGAALLGFFVVRRVAGTRVVEHIVARPKAKAVHDELLRRGTVRAAGFLALVRLSPAMPFAATNLLMAACAVPAPAFVLGTVLGISPRVVAVAVAGSGLAELDLTRAADARLAVVGAAATVVALVGIGVVARRALGRVGCASSQDAEGAGGVSPAPGTRRDAETST